MRVLGIDPGTQVCGYGVIDSDGPELKAVDYGVVRAPRRDLPQRLHIIQGGLATIVERFGPEVAAVEGAFYGRNPRTAMKIGEARGMVLVTLASAEVEIVEYAPATVKQAVTGNGRARKEQVQRMVRVLLDLSETPEPTDAADALALAICHCHRAHLRGLR
jgi:crossover junction endodeoxyribonuclease RuvC